MLSLDLTNAPRWHDLAPGVRVQLRPLTTALMVATRSDTAVEEVPEEASDEEEAWEAKPMKSTAELLREEPEQKVAAVKVAKVSPSARGRRRRSSPWGRRLRLHRS